jgi:chemotaxis protein MotB
VKKTQGGAEPETTSMMRWLLTYADMITLLLALFILLYSISQINVSRFRMAAESVRTTLGASPMPAAVPSPPSPGSPSSTPIGPGPKPMQSASPPRPVEQRQAEQMTSLVKAIQKEGLQHDVHMLQANAGIVIRLQDDFLFDTGTATLLPGAAPVITKVAGLLEHLTGFVVSVEGFTDSQPIATPQFPSNWELSSARALSVLHALVAAGVDPSMLSATGYGEYRPVAPNATEGGRAQNRRVEIVVRRVVGSVTP